MTLIDKHNLFENIDRISHIELELGCGNRKRNPKAIGVDMLDYPDVDIVGDVYEILALLPNESIDEVHGYHFIEHVADVPRLISELSRVVKKGGIVVFVAPHFSNPYFYSDPTHRSFFGLYTFCYYCGKSPFARHVPTYGYKTSFSIEKVDLGFKSSRPFIFRYGFKKIIGFLFNSCSYLKELYEENFCYIFPCYEISYTLRRD
jgi:ubiquinone/menaquinone biosynthesis C-methylase UbiE